MVLYVLDMKFPSTTKISLALAIGRIMPPGHPVFRVTIWLSVFLGVFSLGFTLWPLAICLQDLWWLFTPPFICVPSKAVASVVMAGGWHLAMLQCPYSEVFQSSGYLVRSYTCFSTIASILGCQVGTRCKIACSGRFYWQPSYCLCYRVGWCVNGPSNASFTPGSENSDPEYAIADHRKLVC